MKIKPITAWADAGSHGGIFYLLNAGCSECRKTGRSEQLEGRLAIYVSYRAAKNAGVSSPIKVKIINQNY